MGVNIQTYFREHIPKAVELEITKRMEDQVTQFLSDLDRFESCFDTYNQKLEEEKVEQAKGLTTVLDLLAFKENILAELKAIQQKVIPENLHETWQPYFTAFDALLDPFPSDHWKPQKPERFKITTDHKFPVRGLMQIKSSLWKVSQFPRNCANISRKWRKKELKEPWYWRHHIPIHRMAEFHFRDGLAIQIWPWYLKFYELKSESLRQIQDLATEIGKSFKISENLKTAPVPETQEIETEEAEAEEVKVEKPIFPDIQVTDPNLFENNFQGVDFQKTFQSIRADFELLLSEQTARSHELVNHSIEQFYHDYEKVGTIELSRRQFSRRILNRRLAAFEKQFMTVRDIWSHSLETQVGSWVYKTELKVLRYFSIKEYLRLEMSYGTSINKNMLVELQKLIDYIFESYLRIDEYEGEDEELKQLLRMEKVKATKTLNNDLIPRAVEFILDQNLPKLIAQSEQALGRRVEDFKEELKVSKSNDPERPILPAQTERIMPSVLLQFEAVPSFSNASKKIRTSIFEELNKIQAFVKDINQIIAFTLDSAIASFSQENTSTERAQEIAKEGLQRSMDRTEDVYRELENLFHEVGTNLRSKVLKFATDIETLADLNMISSLKSQISTARAIERTQRIRTNTVNYIRNIIPILGFVIRNQYKKIQQGLEALRTRFGLSKTPEAITVEIADYLANTQTAIARLPFVYQRLFRLEPVNDSTFYVPRKKNIDQLNKALERWQKGNYAPSVLVAERGGGSSTILNFFMEEQKGKTRTFKHNLDWVPESKEGFLSELGKTLGKEDISKSSELIEYLNQLEQPIILVIEEIHHLFIKKVGGFKLLHLLFEVVSATHRKVLWLCSCSSNTWDYLDQTIQISDFFAYTIPVTVLKNEEIIETILKRHRVSGYNVEFLATPQASTNKRLRRVENPKERQKILQEEYFDRLCSFAKSNISLAILYWLRSTQKVEGNTIFIGLDEPDFNFLNALGNEKLFTIFDILIHDGLTESQLTNIRGIHLSQARLDLLNLYDDGILIKEGEAYLVNMLLYRPLLRLLGSRNIIH